MGMIVTEKMIHAANAVHVARDVFNEMVVKAMKEGLQVHVEIVQHLDTKMGVQRATPILGCVICEMEVVHATYPKG
jgi:hypothetical protein